MSEIKLNRDRLDRLDELTDELNERQGNKGVPTAKELTERLNKINQGVESQHATLIVNEIKSLDERIKKEITRIDNKLNKLSIKTPH